VQTLATLSSFKLKTMLLLLYHLLSIRLTLFTIFNRKKEHSWILEKKELSQN